ncbi:MAG: hypothetical protein IJH88_05125 [Eggerthellaceae bacterium]|nr:hypothetical protein [Eggerthellaceae bacterium]
MGKIKTMAALLSAVILMMCMSGCASGQSSASSASDASNTTVNASALGNHMALPLDGPPLSVNEKDVGTWKASILFYSRKEGNATKTTGRFDGTGTLTITRTGYEFKFVLPDGQVKLQSRGTFRTGVQASYVGDTTISGYPYAMLTSDPVHHLQNIKFLTDDLNEWITADCYS